MRLTVAGLRQVVKQDLPIRFTSERLTSYAGLELLRRYFDRIGVHRRVREALQGRALGGDYRSESLAVLIITLLVVGARRLEHLGFVASDPLVGRISRLAQIPSARTVANWLKRFSASTVAALRELNSELVGEQLQRLGVRRVTLDVDGTVVRTGAQVAWAFRGFNPHHRKDPSYYPLLAHVAQTGQILRLRNRPGNIHDSRGALEFLREVIQDLRGRFGRAVVLECRMDAAFFQRDILRRLAGWGCEYAIKVPFWKWVGLRPLVAAQRQWIRIDDTLSAFEAHVPLAAWDMTLRVVVYRKHVAHQTAKNFQLDLFSPDDGHFEYSAITTNKDLTPAALWHFMAGRGAQEKTIAELKGEFALDVVPTRHYAANSAWQQLSILAHNLIKNFQLDTGAAAKPRTRKRTTSHLLHNMRTLRFLLIARAGRLCRPNGRNELRLPANPSTQVLFQDLAHALAA